MVEGVVVEEVGAVEVVGVVLVLALIMVKVVARAMVDELKVKAMGSGGCGVRGGGGGVGACSGFAGGSGSGYGSGMSLVVASDMVLGELKDVVTEMVDVAAVEAREVAVVLVPAMVYSQDMVLVAIVKL
ncbi:hypothetical protein MRB53_028213 [Persea americana]|uniref:Uncharacterized protein n=1 Tax=Persea americana TaxID=3435 RepID=A0ACC2KEY8_PERAE|nr:hypothetical protein MRB53_028213 [Persea americana]